MNVIMSLSGRVAEAIHNANPEETSSVERLTALLALQVVNIGVITASLLVGATTGAFWSTALSLVVFVVLRQLSGGFHFRSLDTCFMVSTTVLSAIPHIDVPAIYPTAAACLIFATKRKFLPSVIVGASVFVSSPIIALAALAQAITILKGGEPRAKTYR